MTVLTMNDDLTLKYIHHSIIPAINQHDSVICTAFNHTGSDLNLLFNFIIVIKKLLKSGILESSSHTKGEFLRSAS